MHMLKKQNQTKKTAVSPTNPSSGDDWDKVWF